MTPEQVLALKPTVLTQKQREFYFENGYVLLAKFLSDEWIRLRAATEEMVDWQPGGHGARCRVGHRQGALARASAPAPPCQHE